MTNTKVPKNYTEIDFDKKDKESVSRTLEIKDNTWYNTVVESPPVHETLLVWDDVYCLYRICETDDYHLCWLDNSTDQQVPFRHTYWQRLTKPDGLGE